jgi:hypothetical protein
MGSTPLAVGCPLPAHRLHHMHTHDCACRLPVSICTNTGTWSHVLASVGAGLCCKPRVSCLAPALVGRCAEASYSNQLDGPNRPSERQSGSKAARLRPPCPRNTEECA